MRYTTLGDGKAVKVIATSEYHPARTVTTCPHPNATALARALERTDRQMAAALYPVAVTQDGAPTQARRRLLGFFDAAATTTDTAATAPGEGAWAAPDALVRAVAAAVAELPTPVLTAARAELASHLTGLDGVLVPARITSTAYRSGVLDVVISGPLAAMDEHWWRQLTQHSGLAYGDDDHTYPVGERTVDAPAELYDLVMELADAEPAGTDFASESVAELLRAGGDGHMPYMILPARLLDAWVTHHRPDLAPLPYT